MSTYAREHDNSYHPQHHHRLHDVELTGPLLEKQVPRQCKVPWSLIRAVSITLVMLAILAVTYDQCVPCVIGVLIFSGLTMHCIPYMSVVFIIAGCVLIYHAIDYKKASIRVEVPLSDVIYVPTWDDLKQYVKVERNAHQRRR